MWTVLAAPLVFAGSALGLVNFINPATYTGSNTDWSKNEVYTRGNTLNLAWAGGVQGKMVSIVLWQVNATGAAMGNYEKVVDQSVNITEFLWIVETTKDLSESNMFIFCVFQCCKYTPDSDSVVFNITEGDLVSPSSSTTTATTSSSGSASSSTASKTTSVPMVTGTQTASSSGMSSQAKIGIGVGVAAAALAVLGAGAGCFFLGRKKSRAAAAATTPPAAPSGQLDHTSSAGGAWPAGSQPSRGTSPGYMGSDDQMHNAMMYTGPATMADASTKYAQPHHHYQTQDVPQAYEVNGQQPIRELNGQSATPRFELSAPVDMR